MYCKPTAGLGFVNPEAVSPISIYGGPQRPTNFTVANHRGYVTPTVSGTYTFQSTNHDDLLLLWVGPNAFDCAYTRVNANMEIRYLAQGTTASYSVSLMAGSTWYPCVYWESTPKGVGWLGFTFTIRGPTGVVLVDGTKGTAEKLCPVFL